MKFYGTNDGKVYYIVDNEKTYLTDEEIEKLNQGMQVELEDGELKRTALEVDTFVSIKIPLQVFQASEDLQKKLLNISLLFSEIQRKTRDGVIVLNNINLKDIPEFLKKEEYTQLKSVGVEFSQEVDDLFSKKKKGK